MFQKIEENMIINLEYKIISYANASSTSIKKEIIH